MKSRVILIALMVVCMLMIVCTLSSCGDRDMRRYESLVAKEKQKKDTVNDIFFDIRLGMTSKAFYVHCWELNKKGLFTDGMGNTKINYKLVKNELKHPADM